LSYFLAVYSWKVSYGDVKLRDIFAVTCILYRWASWSFLERGWNTVTVASPCKDFVSVTVYLLSCVLQTFHWLF